VAVSGRDATTGRVPEPTAAEPSPTSAEWREGRPRKRAASIGGALHRHGNTCTAPSCRAGWCRSGRICRTPTSRTSWRNDPAGQGPQLRAELIQPPRSGESPVSTARRHPRRSLERLDVRRPVAKDRAVASPGRGRSGAGGATRASPDAVSTVDCPDQAFTGRARLPRNTRHHRPTPISSPRPGGGATRLSCGWSVRRIGEEFQVITRRSSPSSLTALRSRLDRLRATRLRR
jgi:hypothetical protein